ncbi:MAG: hypothetical protein ACE5HI_01910, partial [bacterium]
DVMHENRFEKDFENFLAGLTVDEFELLQNVTRGICSFSEFEFQKKAIARSSVIRALNVYRRINYLSGTSHPAVFELGPGCGYLGAMLILTGYPYAATDVTQAFYLYQNRFWNFISDGRVYDFVNNKEEALRIFDKIPKGSAVHIPWWEFVKLKPDSVPQFDIVTCNHALCEMHKYSLGFSLRIARALLQGQDGESPKLFVFEGYGASNFNSIESVNECFKASGFSLAHNDPYITVFVPTEVDSGSESKISTNDVSSGDSISRLFYFGRKSADKTVRIDQVNAFYTDLLGSTDHLTPDEHFLKFIGVDYI